MSGGGGSGSGGGVGGGGAAGRWASARRVLDRVGPWLALALLALVASVPEGGVFLKPENLLNVLRQSSFVGIIALGMTFVIISGGIDLSVGALLAFAGALGIWSMNTVIDAEAIAASAASARELGMAGAHGDLRVALAGVCQSLGLAGSAWAGVLVAVGVAIGTATAAGGLNGVLVTRGRLAPFIATLGGLAAYRSLALTLADGGEVRSSSGELFPTLGAGGVPIPGMEVAPGVPLELPYPVIVFLLLAAVGHVLLHRTRFGRHVVAIGSNERAAFYSAIRVDRVKLAVYALVGLTTGVSAVLLGSRLNSVSSSSTGNLYELDAIAAVVIGGTRMAGGSGTVVGTVVGVLILGVIGNMLNLLDVSPYLQGLVKGLIIIAAVLVQRQGRAER